MERIRSRETKCHRETTVERRLTRAGDLVEFYVLAQIVSFSRRNPADVRLPPGQYLITEFPVLSAGPTRVPLDRWEFTNDGGWHRRLAAMGLEIVSRLTPARPSPLVCSAFLERRHLLLRALNM